ncbi:MAG: bifunctional phosphoribosylaminoimidazolecarboxamide formyltransferase/IMP cyclohydrolase [Planctomycetes bacterium]|nr:bifunctional phosphoribosylaminoimidazolecarboxamide formyltransferase/IMP cyclohydrolase [Planctomycetota bacterium]
MSSCNIKRALMSVYDKTGVVDFARALADEFGVEIISTGGTASLLKENGVPVTPIEEVTNLAEMMDGRVKTLHPNIHAGILADRGKPEHMRQLAQRGIKPIDMVVVNLYPFEQTVADPDCSIEQAIEMIDIGGPCMLRAAAKNHRGVLPVSSPVQYERTLNYLRGNQRGTDEDWPACLMRAAFEMTARYDAEIYRHFAARGGDNPFTPALFLNLLRATPSGVNELRYGENPHQRASVYRESGAPRETWHQGRTPKESQSATEAAMSFNNYVDAGAALSLCREVTRGHAHKAVAAFIKHTNACGCGVAVEPLEAIRKAYLGDPHAAMGGILACNFEITEDIAGVVMEIYDRWGRAVGAGGFFVEVWLATEFLPGAIKVIREKKKWGQRVRVLSVTEMTDEPTGHHLDYRRIPSGMLAQTPDRVGLNEDQWRVLTKRSPTDAEMADLRLAWLICKHTKSNAITVCQDNMLIGNGAGQMSRVMSCRIATWLARENGHGDRLAGSVAASDAFFPFPDGPNLLMDAGVTAIIQPGGSKRDADTIGACDERDVAMIATGTRHFKH